MSYTDWKDKVAGFKKIDVRGVQGNPYQCRGSGKNASGYKRIGKGLYSWP